jgi:RNA polymerase sigma factor (sigma-70 family)
MSSPDAVLLDSVRRGDVGAYGELYQQHVNSAYGLARRFGRRATDADDLVAESFARVLAALLAGRGPDSTFRPYLFTTLRHLAGDKAYRDRKLQFVEDFSGLRAEAVTVEAVDTAVVEVERSLAARAFNALPERWRTVLWHTEIEGQSPAELASSLGLRPNSVAALAYRARVGLRAAYLKAERAELQPQSPPQNQLIKNASTHNGQ